jgi:beta-alanine--pyruvate transaminase
MNGPENSIDFCHGYTYSGHPLAMAAGMATLDVYKEEGIFEHAKEMSKYFEEAIHSVNYLLHSKKIFIDPHFFFIS